MLTASNIFLKYGDRVLLNKINFVIGLKDKVGLVGRNGAGKSTLLKIISKEQIPDEGILDFPKGSTLGYLRQEMDLPKGKTVLEEALSSFEEAQQLEDRLEAINKEIGERTDYESDSYMNLLDEFSTATDRFAFLGGDSMQADAERVLKGLGFRQMDLNRLTDEFSGGWQMRVELAKMLLKKPDFLLLDEPTNHLDIESIIWLEGFLKDYHGAVILISHDRQFLDTITKRTVEIELGNIYDYKAAYSKYLGLRKERRALQESAFKNQQRVIADKERTINRFMAKATKTKMAQSMKKQLDKIERIEIDQEDTVAMNLQFAAAPRSGVVVAEAKQLTKAYGENLVLEEVDFKVDRGDRIAFVGQNGQGKTTLAKIIVNVFPQTKGDLNLGHNVQVGYYAQDQSESLDTNLTLLETMENASPPEMRTKLRNILGSFLFSGEDVDKKVFVLSGGERARLALACMLLRPFNLLVLDEPTNHLDIMSKEVLKQALLKYDGTLLIVSHDREFLSGLTSKTIEFRDKQLFEYIGDVNAFLEKRALDNMRDVEKREVVKKQVATTSNTKLKGDYNLRKKLQKAITNAERKIEKLEKIIEKTESDMGDPAFYEKPDSQSLIEKYQQAKKDLEQVYENWEKAQSEMDKYEF